MILRMQEVFEQPGPEDGDGALRQPSLRSPRLALENAGLVRPVLPQALVEHPQPGRRLPLVGHPGRPRGAAAVGVLLAERPAHRLQLRRHPVPQAPEVLGYRPRRQPRVRRRRPLPGHRLEGPRHRPHLLAVPPVPPLHLHRAGK